MIPTLFQKKLLHWFDQHGRKQLPWQKNITPYRVWLSEIMLQQTQVNTVIPYFERFTKKFSTIEKLAAATEDDVLHLWTGLGYYARARHLHRAAKIIVTEYHGEFPETLEALEKLPGVGRSTAGAILSIAFQKRAPILDGNVKRVLARFHAITEWTGDPNTLNKLWQLAEKYTPQKKIADYTQAIMDLGATVCTRTRPLCIQCPFTNHCEAKKQNLENSLPRNKPRKPQPVRQITLLLLMEQQTKNILLYKRPAQGIWGGLWSLPETTEITVSAIKKMCKTTWGCSVKNHEKWPTFRHTFTHFHLEITPILLNVTSQVEKANATWYPLEKANQCGLAAPIKLLLNQLRERIK